MFHAILNLYNFKLVVLLNIVTALRKYACLLGLISIIGEKEEDFIFNTEVIYIFIVISILCKFQNDTEYDEDL